MMFFKFDGHPWIFRAICIYKTKWGTGHKYVYFLARDKFSLGYSCYLTAKRLIPKSAAILHFIGVLPICRAHNVTVAHGEKVHIGKRMLPADYAAIRILREAAYLKAHRDKFDVAAFIKRYHPREAPHVLGRFILNLLPAPERATA